MDTGGDARIFRPLARSLRGEGGLHYRLEGIRLKLLGPWAISAKERLTVEWLTPPSQTNSDRKKLKLLQNSKVGDPGGSQLAIGT